MKYSALINSAGQCINALGSMDDVALATTDAGDSVIVISEADFHSNPIGRLWIDGAFVGESVAAPISSSRPIYPPRAITQYAFLRRIPKSKRVAIRALAKVSPDVDDFIALTNSALYVDLEDGETINGLHSLCDAAIPEDARLTTELVDAILHAPITPLETLFG